MTTHKFHLCPKCNKNFTPKYKVGSYTGGKILCPRCQKMEKPLKQAQSILKLIQWGHEVGLTFHFSKDLGTELHYVCDGVWKQLEATVDKSGRIYLAWGQTEYTVVHDKRHFMDLVQRHREHISSG